MAVLTSLPRWLNASNQPCNLHFQCLISAAQIHAPIPAYVRSYPVIVQLVVPVNPDGLGQYVQVRRNYQVTPYHTLLESVNVY